MTDVGCVAIATLSESCDEVQVLIVAERLAKEGESCDDKSLRLARSEAEHYSP